MASYDIYLSDFKRTKALKLPIIPKELPCPIRTIQNEIFDTYWNGSYNFIEKSGLDVISWDCWLPTKKYNFAKSNVLADEIINLINTAIDNTEAIRLVIIAADKTIVNDTFSIESFEYKVNFRGDYDYTLSLKQWREYTSKIYKLGWNENGTGWWYCTDVENYKYYQNCWQYIDEYWYSFDNDGYARKSCWLLDKGYWYYLDDKCQMLRNSWKEIDGKWYYFGDQGGMYSNCTTPDGYWVNEKGEWVQ